MLSGLPLHQKLVGIEKPFLEASRWFKNTEDGAKFSLAIINGPCGCGKSLLLDILKHNTGKQFLSIGYDMKVKNAKEFFDILLTLKGSVGKKSSVFVFEDIEEREDLEVLLDIFENSFDTHTSTSYHFILTASENFFIPKWSRLFGSSTIINFEERTIIHNKLVIENALGGIQNTKDKILISQSCEKELNDLRFLLNNIKFYFETGKMCLVFSKDHDHNTEYFGEYIDSSSLKVHTNLPKVVDAFSLSALCENDYLLEYVIRTKKKYFVAKISKYRLKSQAEEKKTNYLKKEYREMRSSARLEIFSTLENLIDRSSDKNMNLDAELMRHYVEEKYMKNRLEKEGILVSFHSTESSALKDCIEPNCKKQKLVGEGFGFKFNEGISVAVRKRVNNMFFGNITANKNT